MALTSNELIEMARKGVSGGIRGAALFHATNNRTKHDLGPAARKFVDDLSRVQPNRDRKVVRHPGATTQGRGVRKPGPLSAGEQAWLTRLPSDPSQMSFEDAQLLASVVQTLPPDQGNDRIAVDRVYHPVKKFWDHKVAEAALENAKADQPTLPASIHSALAETMNTEIPELSPSEAADRAANLLTDADAFRVRIREREISSAQERLESFTNVGATA